MVELLLWDPKQLTKERGDNKEKRKLATIPSTILWCKCYHMIVALEFFNSKRLCATMF